MLKLRLRLPGLEVKFLQYAHFVIDAKTWQTRDRVPSYHLLEADDALALVLRQHVVCKPFGQTEEDNASAHRCM